MTDKKEYLLDLLGTAEDWVVNEFDEGLEKTNISTKLAEATFWITYYFEQQDEEY